MLIQFKITVLSHFWLFSILWTVPTRFLHPWDFPGKNTRVGCHLLLQGIFPTQGWTHVSCIGRWILYHWATWESQNNIVQFSSVAQLCMILCNPMDCSMPGLPVHHQLPEFTQIHVHWVGDAIQPTHPLSPPSPPAFTLSQNEGLFKWVSSSHQVTKYCSFSFNISPSSEHSGQIAFRMDWLDLLAVQGTLKSLE